MKTCSKCHLEKEYDCFYIGKGQCKNCIKEIRVQYYADNKMDILEYKKEFYQENKSDITEYKAAYYINNKSTVRKSQNKYKKKRRKIDPPFRLREIFSRAICVALNSAKNNISILEFLPYTMAKLKIHIEQKFESWMTWNNQGMYNPKTWDDNDPTTWTWQLDHIIPQSDLSYKSMEDDNFKKCWALSNLRPLSSKQNLIDGVNRARHRK